MKRSGFKKHQTIIVYNNVHNISGWGAAPGPKPDLTYDTLPR